MQNNFQKFLFLAILIGVITFSGATHPALFVSGNASATGISNTSSQKANNPPVVVLPSLSADIGAQASIASGSNTLSDLSMNTSTSPTPFIRIANTGNPNVGSAVSLIADLQTGIPFLTINNTERWPMASVSKLMTAVVATDLLQPDQKVTITSEMTAVDPSEQILHVGDTYTVSDLLRVMLLPSNNVAAESLAQFAGRAQFLAAMNAKAQAWGMTNTYYDDPSGLSAANESTANDLLKLAQQIYTNYPQVLAITRMPQATVSDLATGQPVIVKSINNFAGQADFIGGKTGYTDQSDGNLLSIFSYDGRPVFIVVLGIDDGVRFNATQELYNWFKANFK
jgi:D-alanyl-D-alanine endopeptidase (penicillin-binding protein 7)